MSVIIFIVLWSVAGYAVGMYGLDRINSFVNWFETASKKQQAVVITAMGPAVWWLCAMSTLDEI